MGRISYRFAPLGGAVLGLLLVVFPAAGAVGWVREAAAAAGGWVRPVDGAVVRAFQEPAGAYAAGHRGVDLAAPPGTPVLAAGDGTVSFAGEVAGSLHVVVAHDGGLRTSYSFLELIAVRVGAVVAAGDPVGLAGGSGAAHEPGVLHFGLRLGERYLDPMLLYAPTDLTRVVRLVPAGEREAAPWTSPAEEAARLARELSPAPVPLPPTVTPGTPSGDGCGDGVPLVGSAVSVMCRAAGGVVGGVSTALDAGLSLLGRAGRAGVELARQLRGPLTAMWQGMRVMGEAAGAAALATPLGRSMRDVVEMGARFVTALTRTCAEAPAADGTGGSGHSLVAVGGIDSSIGAVGDRSFGLDAAALGYHTDEIHWFSYSSGPTYAPIDTHGDLRRVAFLLAEQLRVLERSNPGREVDLIAHSQGGVVVDLFLTEIYEPGDRSFPPIGTVVTLASPHEGVPLGAVNRELRGTRTGRSVLALVDRTLPGPPSSAPSVIQLAEGSPLMTDLWRRGLPYNVELTSIGGNDDVFVPANHIAVPGGTDVVVTVAGPNDHGNVPHDARALQVVRAALEQRPLPCATLGEAIRGALEPVLFSRVAHDLGTTVRSVSTMVP